MLPFSKWPLYDNQIISKSSNILKSGKVNYWTGRYGKAFEKKFSNYFNLNYSFAVSNGSIALELALLSIGISEGDEVIVTSRSYYSSVSSVIRVKAKPVFADIELDTFNISPQSVIKNITKNTKAIICVHLYGMPCDIYAIKKITQNSKIKIIEDCSQAHGACIDNKKVGSIGDIGIWSFCNDKIISTGGEGGMLSTNNKIIADKIWSLKEIGKNLNKMNNVNKSLSFPFIHDYIGTNARMTEIQSMIGLEQIKKLDLYLKKRNQNATYLTKHLSKFQSIITPTHIPNYQHSFYRYVIRLNFSYIKKQYNQQRILELLNKNNVFANVGGCPAIYKEKYFKNNKIQPRFKSINTEQLTKTSISFQIDHTITKSNLTKMLKKIIKVLKVINK